MTAPLIKLLTAIILPTAVFFIGGYLMLNLTGRDAFPQTSAPESVPLHFRMGSYNVEQVQAYWNWLGPEGRGAELRFLHADLVFPVMYGGAILVALLIVSNELGRPLKPQWLVLPVGITVAADWGENLLHWQQLSRFLKDEPVQAAWLQLSSLATTTKTIFFALSVLLLLVMATWRISQFFRRQGF
ncbi:MAG TPA: hypothetical protein ENN94_01925 [Geoalkalibacter subterraneus]|uniref:Uncharacterized protein n=1 Tax=Geoalkalibacter subterraneus TaxID=483547 RepID=A0A831LRC6_9BACT|nr:hypothetical protein [Geoalkalibacter subterraneus]